MPPQALLGHGGAIITHLEQKTPVGEGKHMGRKRMGGLLAMLAVALVTMGLVLGAGTKAYAEDVSWDTDQTFDSDEVIKDRVSAGRDITVTIAEGKTVKLWSGMYIYSHTPNMYTITVAGKGTLEVYGGDGEIGENTDSGRGEDGTAAIYGSLTVDGATVLCFGGEGGAGKDGDTPGSGGNGAPGITGSLTVKSGTATVAGGDGGAVGNLSPYDTEGPTAGKAGKAVQNEIDAKFIQESDDEENWSAVSGNTSDKQFVKATSEPEPTPEPTPTPAANQEMYRLYNPNSGEHFYTANKAERDSVVAAGWTYEGVGWVAPTEGEPVYRLYNEFGGEHHYTPSKNERDTLVKAGWKDEGIGWKTAGTDGVPLYRQYNPNAFANNHNYTPSAHERDTLLGLGWKDEGVAWYGVR